MFVSLAISSKVARAKSVVGENRAIGVRACLYGSLDLDEMEADGLLTRIGTHNVSPLMVKLFLPDPQTQVTGNIKSSYP